MISKSPSQASDLSMRYMHAELSVIDRMKTKLTPLDWHFAETCLRDVLVTTGVPAVVPATYAIIAARADILCNIAQLEMYYRFKDPRTIAETLNDVYQVTAWKYMLTRFAPEHSKDSMYEEYGYESDEMFVYAHESCTTFIEYLCKFCGFHTNISLETDSVWLKRVHQRMAHARVNTASKKTILDNIDQTCSKTQVWAAQEAHA